MTSNTSLAALIGDAGLDPAGTSAMQLVVDDLGPVIQAGLGEVDIDDITTAEVVLVTVVIDDSSSIRFGQNTDLVRQGHNQVIEALKAAKASAGVLMSCQYLNGPVLYPYVALDNAVQMSTSNFNPSGGTPLYDRTAEVLATVTAKMSEFEQGGVAARAITIIVTDGADGHSRRQTPSSVRTMVEALTRTEQHITAAVGIDDGYTDFRQVFTEMGLLQEWILTPGNSPAEIRAAFGTVSQSAVRASQVANFSQGAIGGFGN